MIPLVKLTTEAYQSDPEDGVTHFGASEVDFIGVAAGASPRQRCRILLHPGTDAKLHSMLVAYKAGTYIRPNRHRGKDESVTVVSGECVAVFFDDSGNVTRGILMGPEKDGLAYFVRIPAGVWHTLLMLTDCVFLESTPGPFDPADTEYAPWSPEEGSGGVEAFLARVNLHVPVYGDEPGKSFLPMREITPQVYQATDGIVPFCYVQGVFLGDKVDRGGFDRARICAHRDDGDRLQEMLLGFADGARVRSSRHSEDETLFVLAGTGTYCFFDDHGSMVKQVPLGPLGSGKSCFCRVPKGRWHTLLLDGPMLVLEAAPGPWKKENTEYAPWEAKRG